MTHSPEPWRIGEENEAYADLCDSNDKLIGTIRAGWGIKLPNDAPQSPRANAERIFACVNACRDIPNSELAKMDSGKGQTLMQALLLLDPHTNTALSIMSDVICDDGEISFDVGHDGKVVYRVVYRHTIKIEEVD